MGPILILLLALCASDVTLAYKTLTIGPIGNHHALTKRDTLDVVNHNKIRIFNLHVESRIEYRFATTRISSRIGNTANFSQEVSFSVTIPETAFISGFKMEVDGKVYEAYVKEKEAAKQEYTQAVARGLGAAHVAASARDSNHFTVSVNVEASKKVTFNLTYDEMLTRRMGVYNLAINIDPGKIVRSMTVDVHIKENRNITVLRVPELRSGNEVDADDTTRGNDLATITRVSPSEAHVSFSPTLEQQQSLGHVGALKKENSNKPLKGQFVVQYDVDRDSETGEVLVNDGYFVHFFAPKNLPPLRKHVIFVLDVSGSMDQNLDQLKEAMATILDGLNVGDYFNIIEFSAGVKVWNLDSMAESFRSGWEQPWNRQMGFHRPGDQLTPTPAFPATEEYIAAAKQHILAMSIISATNIYEALRTAIRVGHVGLQNVTDNSTEEKPAPSIFFLTDGQPSERSTEEILATVEKENQNPKAAIFSLAFGDDADFDFLKRLSLRNSGFARKIYQASDAALQLRDFYRQIASPLLANVTFNYQPDQVVEGATTRTRFPYFFLGSEIVVAGKLSNEIPEIRSVSYLEGEISRVSKLGNTTTRLYVIPPQLDTEAPVNDTVKPIEKLWAYLTIKQLLENQEDADTNQNQTLSENKQRALALALQYSFVTPLTSLVVVKPNATEDLVEDRIRNPPHNMGSWPIMRHALQHSARNIIPAPTRQQSYSGAYPGHAYLRHSPIQYPHAIYVKTGPLPDSPDYDEPIELLRADLAYVNEPTTEPPQPPPALIPQEDLEWLESVRNESGITLPFGPNGENITYSLQLTPGTPVLRIACLAPPTEQEPYCDYLIDCPLNIFKQDIQSYRKFFCTVKNNFAGVCCPYSLLRKISKSTTHTMTTTTTTSPEA